MSVRPLVDYHHFRRGAISADERVSVCEQRVVQLLLESRLTEDERDSSVVFELKHHHSTAQFARVLARQRALPLDACTVGALLHDIYVITNGRYADHAHRGTPIALGIMDEIGGFSLDDRSMVERIVFHHSDKHLWSSDPFIEFGKDADVLDCFLYPGAFGFYLRHKPLAVFAHYLERAKRVWREVGMPEESRFAILDTFSDCWMNFRTECLASHATTAVAGLLRSDRSGPPPPLLISARDAGSFLIVLSRESWESHLHQNVGLGDDARVTVAKLVGGEVKRRHDASREDDARLVLRVAASTGVPVIVWPALDAYEVLSDVERVVELGLDPEELASQTSKPEPGSRLGRGDK